MEEKIQNRIIIITGVLISIGLVIYSFLPQRVISKLPFDSGSIILSFLSIVLVTILIKILFGFNSKDRENLNEIINWISNKNSSIQEEINLKVNIFNDIKNSDNYWLLASTGTGFFSNYEEAFAQKRKIKANRIITLNPDSEQYKLYIKKINDTEKEKTISVKFADLVKDLPRYGVYKQCNSLPNFSLLIINPNEEGKSINATTKIYLFIKLNSELLGKDPIIIIRNTDERIYKEFIEFYDKTWKEYAC